MQVVPMQKGMEEMHRRQKLTIGGVTKWVSFSSTQELVDLVTKIVRAGEVSGPQEKKLFGEYLREWYEVYHRPKLKKGTAINYDSMIRNHILPIMGNRPIDDIRAADVQNVMSTLKSASMAKQVKVIISMAIDSAIADELYHHPNPTRDKRIVMPTAKKKREGLSMETLTVVMDILPTFPEEYSRILAMLMMTGCRRGEALGARWEDIDWKSGTIHLQRVVRFINNRPEVSSEMKTAAADRAVSLWPEFVPYLGERQNEGFIIHCDGEPLSERQYRIRWKGIMKQLKAAGIEEAFTAHQLRHTYATVAANSGRVPAKALQGMLGHANFQTTMNVYAGLDTEQMRESSRKLGCVYAEIGSRSCRNITEESDT